MPYTLDLSSSWAKIERAKMHIDHLFAEIEKVCPNGKVFTLRRQFERENGAVVYYIDRVAEVPKNWSLIIGDAVHNLRGALDHLAWQLAIRYFDGVAPSDKRIIKKIQFPVVSDIALWPKHPHREYMDSADAAKLERFQPFNLDSQARASGAIHPLDFLAGFNGLSNIDKHRTIHLAYGALHSITLFHNRPFRDCIPSGDAAVITLASDVAPNTGDEVFRIPVVATGPNPDVDFQASLTGYVALGEKPVDVVYAFEPFTKGVSEIVSEFA